MRTHDSCGPSHIDSRFNAKVLERFIADPKRRGEFLKQSNAAVLFPHADANADLKESHKF